MVTGIDSEVVEARRLISAPGAKVGEMIGMRSKPRIGIMLESAINGIYAAASG